MEELLAAGGQGVGGGQESRHRASFSGSIGCVQTWIQQSACPAKRNRFPEKDPSALVPNNSLLDTRRYRDVIFEVYSRLQGHWSGNRRGRLLAVDSRRCPNRQSGALQGLRGGDLAPARAGRKLHPKGRSTDRCVGRAWSAPNPADGSPRARPVPPPCSQRTLRRFRSSSGPRPSSERPSMRSRHPPLPAGTPPSPGRPP